jgi:hypothetical protein
VGAPVAAVRDRPLSIETSAEARDGQLFIVLRVPFRDWPLVWSRVFEGRVRPGRHRRPRDRSPIAKRRRRDA